MCAEDCGASTAATPASAQAGKHHLQPQQDGGVLRQLPSRCAPGKAVAEHAASLLLHVLAWLLPRPPALHYLGTQALVANAQEIGRPDCVHALVSVAGLRPLGSRPAAAEKLRALIAIAGPSRAAQHLDLCQWTGLHKHYQCWASSMLLKRSWSPSRISSADLPSGADPQMFRQWQAGRVLGACCCPTSAQATVDVPGGTNLQVPYQS